MAAPVFYQITYSAIKRVTLKQVQTGCIKHIFKQAAPALKRGWHGRKSKASCDKDVAGRARRDADSDFAIRPCHPRKHLPYSVVFKQQYPFQQTKKKLLFQAGFLNLVGERG